MTKRLVSVIAILLGVTLLTASIPYNYSYVNADVVVAERQDILLQFQGRNADEVEDDKQEEVLLRF